MDKDQPAAKRKTTDLKPEKPAPAAVKNDAKPNEINTEAIKDHEKQGNNDQNDRGGIENRPQRDQQHDVNDHELNKRQIHPDQEIAELRGKACDTEHPAVH